mmetsp:Transcript_53603/g.96319  ORF Transcript_53603/g.96319 Transcript_53603/m.96319 type:complete len:338 (+) Transcript_53603:43-1056(+)
MGMCSTVFQSLAFIGAALGICYMGMSSFSGLSAWVQKKPTIATLVLSSRDYTEDYPPLQMQTTTITTTTSTATTTQWMASWHNHDLTGSLSSAKCSELMDDETSNFYAIWHFVGYSFIKSSEQACWIWRWWSPNREQKFFDDVLAGVSCDRNWNSGVRGGWTDRNVYPSPAPALLGEDAHIHRACCSRAGKEGAKCDDKDIANICVEGSYNVLMVVNVTNPWNLCLNLVWQLCAVLGKLPGQNSRTMHFAPAPKNYPAKWWVDGVSWNGGQNFANGAVSVAEVCILSEICSNRDQLFSIEEMEPFTCDLDVQRYRKFAAALMHSSNPAGVTIREMGV